MQSTALPDSFTPLYYSLSFPVILTHSSPVTLTYSLLPLLHSVLNSMDPSLPSLSSTYSFTFTLPSYHSTSLPVLPLSLSLLPTLLVSNFLTLLFFFLPSLLPFYYSHSAFFLPPFSPPFSPFLTHISFSFQPSLSFSSPFLTPSFTIVIPCSHLPPFLPSQLPSYLHPSVPSSLPSSLLLIMSKQ